MIVDDGSRDGTRRMLSEARSGNPNLKPLLGSGVNRGKGAAIAAGVRHADGDYVLLADVDLSTPLEELPKLMAAGRDGADIAIGSRGLPGSIVERGPAHRKLTGKTFSGAVRILTGLRIRDTQNGFKLLSADSARELLAEQLCPGFAFDVELLLRADMAGLRIVEVPVLYVHDSRSRVRVASASIEMLRDVIVLAYRLKPRRAARSASSARRGLLSGHPADETD